MPKLIYSSTDRDEAHRQLEKLIPQHPLAECREDHNAEKPYQVWDGSVERTAAPPAPASEPEFSIEDLRKLKKLLEQVK